MTAIQKPADAPAPSVAESKAGLQVVAPAGKTESAAAPAAKPAPAPKAAPAPAKAAPPVAGAVMRKRHYMMRALFVVVGLLPAVLTAGYMWFIAKDQYHSDVSFTVQSEDTRTAVDIFGGLSQMAGVATGATDQQILYQYLLSQDLVVELDRMVDLRAIYSRNWPHDPVFAYPPSGSIEDLHAYWLRNVTVNQDNSGLMSVRVLGPSPEDALRVTTAVFDLATTLINRIATSMRDDTERYAREELSKAEERLSAVRQELAAFRLRTQIIDPSADVQSQMGILGTLQARLADTMIELNNLPATSAANDPRRAQLERTRASIEGLIAEERRKFGEGWEGPGGEDYATIIAEYERLMANSLFAEQTYHAAMANYDSVMASSTRQARYLAAHIRPTLAERALYPQRIVITLMALAIGILVWALGVLIYYSVRDRR